MNYGAITLVLFSVMVSSAAEDPSLRLENLRCEYLVNPSAVDEKQPRLSWELRSEERGQKQTAYQVLVASTPEKLASNGGDLWDSGRIAATQSAHVIYRGRELTSRQRCYWKVRVWDGHGKASDWSAPASWTMGLLRREDWDPARWISDPDDREAPAWGRQERERATSEPKAAVMLRKEFDIERPLRRATLYVTARGNYEVRINGERVSDEVLAPEWTEFEYRIQYRAHDVTNLLRQDGNAIGVLLGEGWYAGWYGSPRPPNPTGHFMELLLRLEIELEDGATQTIVTDGTWKSTIDGPITSTGHYVGEIYDARKEMRGWDTPGFDASAWNDVVVNEALGDQAIVAQPNDPIRITETVAPIGLREHAPGVYILDMGQNMSGQVRVRVRGPAGTRIHLHHGERLDDEGSVYTRNLRHAENQRNIYIKDTDDEEVYQPHFTYQGFRYVQMTGFADEPTLDDFVGLRIHSDAPRVGWFESSNSLINQLMENIHRTQTNNMHSVITDCPQRNERFGWLGDGQIFSQTSIYFHDMAAFYTKWLCDIRDNQKPDGRYTEFSPRASFRHMDTWRTAASGWADAGVILPWRVYQNYGDKRLLERHYDSAKRYVDFLDRTFPDRIKRGDKYGDWVNGDTVRLAGKPNVPVGVPKDVYATAFFAHSTDLVSRMARVLGRDNEAQHYETLFREIAEAYNREFVDEDGRIQGDTQAGYALALQFDLLPESIQPRAAAHLVEAIVKYNGHLSTGIQGTFRAMHALTRYDFHDEAYRLINLREFPSWGYMIEQGATSIWERWDGYVAGRGFATPTMNSFNHPAFGAVGEWVWQHLAGIGFDEASPGYEHIVLRPLPAGDLTWVKARYHSIRGPIVSEWSIDDGRLTYRVSIPPGTTATVYLPPIVDVQTIRESGQPVADAIGVTALNGDESVFHIDSGAYTFTADVR